MTLLFSVAFSTNKPASRQSSSADGAGKQFVSCQRSSRIKRGGHMTACGESQAWSEHGKETGSLTCLDLGPAVSILYIRSYDRLFIQRLR